MNRRPGIKGVTLTPKGNEFLTLASRYLEVEKDIKTWKENLSCYELKVSAPHSINSFLFTGLYSRFSGSSQLRLTISTHWNLSLIHIYLLALLDLLALPDLPGLPAQMGLLDLLALPRCV